MFRSIARTYKAAFSGLPRDIWLLSAVLMVNRAGTMVLPFISLYLTQEKGLDVTTAGALLSLYGLGSAIGAWVGRWPKGSTGHWSPCLARMTSPTCHTGHVPMSQSRCQAPISNEYIVLHGVELVYSD